MASHRETSSPQQTIQSSPSSPSKDDTEELFRHLLNQREARADLTDREKNLLRQPVTSVSVDNIFTWHLSQHSIIENETDPELIRRRIWQRRVGVKECGRLTEEQITVQEKRLGVRLPALWRDVYKHFNGGWVDTLRWGDMDNPGIDDIVPVPQSSHQYLALEDVARLRDILPVEWEELEYGILDCSGLDSRLIAIALAGSEAVLLDYRESDEPRVCLAHFDKYDDNPLAGWETDEFTFWWPDMEVFFRGLYQQSRIV
ncbi:SMI1/KNR4 family protein [Sinorhizobium sp. RAC02]|uniref:SMI1/KNR4 family protein n=1 Tax=Sinorhizobium sp. RAC02 TaxID=1842534 RepID=UPI001495B9FE|nr:SMI1/KNR4 family protein [Sinorhizobium sp. RAC02]